MQVNLFWALTITAILAAMAFIIPPIIVAPRSNNNSVSLQSKSILIACFIIILSFSSLVYAIYSKIGSGAQMQYYYSAPQTIERANNKQIRPLYARLQRELLKAELNQAVDLANIELILYFANIHADIGGGVLPEEIIKLLNNVLKSHPTQVAALKLLAVHAAKK